ncbi:fatty acid desaturase [Pyxidicoccus xibeiensis]|uniref:fatty acid desaturase n=1 Tax=Pyxidicoccus xibeiensis TaxID=2906759 RepID=UPI0020A7937B|nr:fatty acid desaturase [Pyxidicoccus xibeiensis]MCP3142040.1 fatty acid desaturase [Pyxidicoccus xibeiensis]
MEEERIEIRRKELRPLLSDLMEPDMKVFWSYFLLATLSTWASLSFLIYRANNLRFDLVFFCVFFVSVICVYHAVTFTHELAHLDQRRFGSFFWAWNLLVGGLFAIPAFIYGDNHLDHHSKKYGTSLDPEYINFKKAPTSGLVEFLGMNLFLPYLGILRFCILTPVSHLHSRLRQLVLREASFMGMKSRFARRVSEDASVLKSWSIQEMITFAYLWALVFLVLSGKLHWSAIVVWASIITFVGVINGIRALAVTHKYFSMGDAPIPWSEHIEECIEIENRGLSTLLFCPVGTQYHMTHHMFPSIPFHHLPEARRRLSPHFEKDSFYHANVRKGIIDGLRRFLQGIYSTSPHRGATARTLVSRPPPG